MTAAFILTSLLVVTSICIGTNGIIAACYSQRSSLYEHLRQLLSRLIIYGLDRGPCHAHLLSTHFLSIVKTIYESDGFVFIYCHFYLFRSCSCRRSKSTTFRHSAYFAAFFRSWHLFLPFFSGIFPDQQGISDLCHYFIANFFASQSFYPFTFLKHSDRMLLSFIERTEQCLTEYLQQYTFIFTLLSCEVE